MFVSQISKNTFVVFFEIGRNKGGTLGDLSHEVKF